MLSPIGLIPSQLTHVRVRQDPNQAPVNQQTLSDIDQRAKRERERCDPNKARMAAEATLEEKFMELRLLPPPSVENVHMVYRMPSSDAADTTLTQSPSSLQLAGKGDNMSDSNKAAPVRPSVKTKPLKSSKKAASIGVKQDTDNGSRQDGVKTRASRRPRIIVENPEPVMTNKKRKRK